MEGKKLSEGTVKLVRAASVICSAILPICSNTGICS